MRFNSLPDGWNKYFLRDMIERVVGGGTPSRAVQTYWNGDIPWASVKDFRDTSQILNDTEEHISPLGLANSAANLIEPGAALICTRMAVGRAAISAHPVAINQDIKALYPREHLHVRYLLLLLAFTRRELESKSIGSTVKGITLKDLLSLQVLIPPLPEQRRIADMLDTVDAAIQQTEALIAKLKLMKAGLLHDLLTRGLDEQGNLRDPDAHPEQFKDSPLGRIPRGWEVRSLGTICTTKLLQ
jgi:type I restriction enzyme S subunit